MAETVEYKYTTSSLSTILSNQSSSDSASYTGNTYIMPSQLWKGYYDEDSFNDEDSFSNHDMSPVRYKPSEIFYRNFGKSVLNYGCAVCCCLAAVALI